MLASSYEIEVAGVRFAAELSLKPLYDAKGERVRGYLGYGCGNVAAMHA